MIFPCRKYLLSLPERKTEQRAGLPKAGRRCAMFNHRVLAVIKRELKEKLMSKTFIFMTILLPFIMFGGIAIQLLLQRDEAKSTIDLVTESSSLTESFQTELLSSDLMKDGKYTFTFYTMKRDDLKGFLDKKKQTLLEGDLTGIVFVPESAMKDKKIEYYSKTPTNPSLSRRLESPLNKVLIDSYFHNKSLSLENIERGKNLGSSRWQFNTFIYILFLIISKLINDWTINASISYRREGE